MLCREVSDIQNLVTGRKAMENSEGRLNRREFLQKGTAMTVGSAALTNTALSYTRILGANDRISLGHIGIGNRGSELDGIVAGLKDDKKVELTAVCDLWTQNLDRAVAANQKHYGKPPPRPAARAGTAGAQGRGPGH